MSRNMCSHISQQGPNPNNFAQLPKYDLPTFLNVNARSLTKKLDELDVVIRQNHVDICAITESWFSESVPEAPVSINGYKLLRNDRDGRVGGGVCVYVNLSIPYKEWSDLEDPAFETKWITLRPKKLPREYPHLLVGVIYHPTTQHREMTEHIIKSVDHILSHHPVCGIVLVGDFNQLPDHGIISQCKLKQIVTKPTRENATLDKIFTNMILLYSEPSVLPKLGTSDHSMVLMKPSIRNSFKTGQKYSVTTRCMGPNEKALFSHDLQHVNWAPLYRTEHCQDQFDFLMETIHTLYEKHFPLKEVTRHSSDKPWVTDAFRCLVKERQDAHHKGQVDKYKQLRNNVNRLSKSLRSRFYTTKVSHLKAEKPKLWWKHINALMGRNDNSKGGVTSLANNLTEGNMDNLATRINDFFKSVSKPLEPLASDNHYLNIKVDVVPSEYIISVTQVEKQLLKVNPRKASEPDKIPGWILKDFASVLGASICAIYNSSIRSGVLPQMWRSADIAPLPKINPPKAIESDLRPISLTPVISKNLI